MDKPFFGHDEIDLDLEQLKWNASVAVSVSRLRAENCPLIRRSEMFCFSKRENLYTFPLMMRTAKKYNFLSQINAVIRRCIEAGLIQKWQRDSKLYATDSKQIDDRRVILTVAHIGGGLCLLCCGLSVALLTLTAECVAYRKMKQENCHIFWLLLSQCVDGRRFYFPFRRNKEEKRISFLQRHKHN